jgi:hypothetical protein
VGAERDAALLQAEQRRPAEQRQRRRGPPPALVPDVAGAGQVGDNEQRHRQTAIEQARRGDLFEVDIGIIERQRHGVGILRQRQQVVERRDRDTARRHPLDVAGKGIRMTRDRRPRRID